MTRPSNATLLPVRLQWADRSFNGQALVDSGAEGNLMDFSLARKLHIPITALEHTITIHALNGQELPGITHVTGLITLITSGNHSERISLYLTQSPHAPIVLGHPWFAKHRPRIEWGQNSEEPVNLSNVPPEYLDLKEVFSKSRAASLPPHRPYDCAIDLLPAPILIAPDPSRQFVVEVDMSEMGVGAVLSLRSPTDDKMHPCAFLSRRLSPAERNYDIDTDLASVAGEINISKKIQK
ncbi:hypothetical protein PO909_025376 [Leuciscus waleckii]